MLNELRSKKIEEALSILRMLGMPKEQLNERSALCLLALLNVTPEQSWQQATGRLIGITPIMDWIKEWYAKDYAPNSRETIRRYSIHQFIEAGFVLNNPDISDRPINSPKTVYKIDQGFLDLIRTFSSDNWDTELNEYTKNRSTLIDIIARKRDMICIPVKISSTKTILISPGEHSELIRQIIEQFAERFVHGSQLVYVGDTGEKSGYVDLDLLSSLGIDYEKHGKMPDVVLYDLKRKWLVLIESVTSHGPVNWKRHEELSRIFSKSTAGLVFVTAFPNRSIMSRYVGDIAWETEVWVADSPTHLIHFNGERFLGPY